MDQDRPEALDKQQQQPHVVSDSFRTKEAFKYIQFWEDTARHVSLSSSAEDHANASRRESAGPSHAVGSNDTSLAAFAQLGSLRLQAQRCIITLLGHDTEYVIAESTPTLSLQSDEVHDSPDALWLGICSFARNEGLTGHILDRWQSTQGHTQHYYITNNVSQDSEVNSIAFTRAAPRTSFLVSVPIRTHSGVVIGSYTVLDDKPRYGVTGSQMVFLEDMADTVMAHLENKRKVVQRQRGDRLIKALALFNTGKASIRDWWLTNQNQQMRGEGHSRRNQWIDDNQLLNERADEELGSTYRADDLNWLGRRKPRSRKQMVGEDVEKVHPPSRSSRSLDAVSNHSKTSGSDTVESQAPSNDVPPGSQSAAIDFADANSTFKSKLDPAQEIPRIFSRASNLIREALSVDGAIFVDVPVTARPDLEGRFDDTSSADGQTNSESSTSGEKPDRGHDDKMGCSVMGFATKDRSSIRGFTPSSRRNIISHRLMRRLLRRYPQGRVFTFTQAGLPWTSSSDEAYVVSPSAEAQDTTSYVSPRVKTNSIAAKLADIFPSARTIAFLPIWDSSRETWRGASFVWSLPGNRILDQEEDLTYLAAFANSIGAELSKLDALAADQAKASFIASVSHELRSPLHGILAGIETLQEEALSPHQQDMTTIIGMAGNTLLDTVNNILDFSKINSFTDVQRHQRVEHDLRRDSESKMPADAEVGVTRATDLCVLTENVVDTVVKGYQFQSNSRNQLTSGSEMIRSGASGTPSPVLVILDIDKSDSRHFGISPGSWSRILTNLVGNALKYTNKGTVTISLSIGEPDGEMEVDIKLRIQDTGRGISADYLQNHLYTPFMQEDSHSVGTGLGLSIVRQLVGDMDGNIDVKSEVGRGTTVVVHVKAFQLGGDIGSSPYALDLQALKLEGPVKACMIQSSDNTSSAMGALQQRPSIVSETAAISAVTKTLEQWLGCTARTIADPKEASQDEVCFMTEAEFQDQIAKHHSQGPENTDSPSLPWLPSASLILTDQPVPPKHWAQNNVNDAIVLFVSQPFGPQKLSLAINTILAERKNPNGSSKTFAIPSPVMRSGSFSQPMQTRSPKSSPVPFNSDEPSEILRARKASVGSNTPVSRPGSTRMETDSSSPRVLLVEDNKINMNLLLAVTKKLGYAFVTAENGQEAVKAYSANPSLFRLVLMDISMPVMDGMEATRRIREYEHRERRPRCKIMAITGLGHEGAQKAAFESGVDGYLTKPVSLGQLRSVVQEAMNKTDEEIRASP